MVKHNHNHQHETRTRVAPVTSALPLSIIDEGRDSGGSEAYYSLISFWVGGRVGGCVGGGEGDRKSANIYYIFQAIKFSTLRVFIIAVNNNHPHPHHPHS
jgi:hypothetical protein